MTIRATSRLWAAGLLIGLIAVAATLWPMLASSGSDPVREIRIVARDMAFYVDGAQEPNPTITVRAGQRVRFILRNEEPGLSHDFVVKAWGAGTKLLDSRGEEDSVTIQMPEQPGSTTYHCTPHAKMMSGTLRVE